MFNCSVNDKVFTVKCNLLRHVKSHEQIKFTSGDCKQNFTRRSNLSDHIQSKHGTWNVLSFNLTNFTLFKLINEVKKINMSIDYSKDIITRDVSTIDTVADAASFLVGIIQTCLGKKDQQKSESLPACVHIVNNNYNIISNHSNVNDKIIRVDPPPTGP